MEYIEIEMKGNITVYKEGLKWAAGDVIQNQLNQTEPIRAKNRTVENRGKFSSMTIMR